MADPVRIVGIPGALRTASLNRKLLALAAREAEKAGASVEVLDLKALALPVYDQDVEDAGLPEPVTRLKEAIHRAQGVIISTPEYNASVPGGLKNAIDWVSRPSGIPNPWRDKVLMVVGASGGPSGTRAAQPHLRQSLAALGAWVLPGTLFLPNADHAFDERGELKDDRTRAQLAKLVPLFVQFARQGAPKV
jgi:chromate reductase